MPALSPTMTQGNLGKWKKKVGDEINPGDVLVEIETDKATMDFECQDEGFLAKILIEDQKDVLVNKAIGVLVENQSDVSAFESFVVEENAPKAAAVSTPPPASSEANASSSESSKSSATQTPSVSSSAGGRIFASPMAKVAAASKNISLDSVHGSGPNGRITKSDVESFKPSTATKASPPASKTAPQAAGAAFADIPLSNVRKVIAERLTQSKVSIPHYYLTNEIAMDKIIKLRQTLNEQASGAFKLSVNDFIVKAAGLALRDVPEVNSAWMESYIRQYKSSDVAVAVATDSGLITPIVTGVEGKGLVGISQKIKELAGRAKENKLAPNEYQGGTFTISNLGMYNISHFTAIINPPHSGILAVGSVSDKVVKDGEGFKSIKVASVTLSLDHRVVDGAVGARWMAKFTGYLEDPLKMML